MQSVVEENKLEIPRTALDKAKRYFQLSQTKNGLDLSLYDFDELNNLITDIENFTSNNLYPHDEDVVYNQILDSARDKDGKLDLNLINDVFDVINGQDLCFSFKQVAETLKHFYRYDNKSKEEIKSMFAFLIDLGFFELDSENKNFYMLMNLCFDNDKKFNPLKADILEETCMNINARIYNEVEKEQEDDDDDDIPVIFYSNTSSGEPFINFEDIDNETVKLISSYFDKITDANGNLKTNRISFDDYFENIFSNP